MKIDSPHFLCRFVRPGAIKPNFKSLNHAIMRHCAICRRCGGMWHCCQKRSWGFRRWRRWDRWCLTIRPHLRFIFEKPGSHECHPRRSRRDVLTFSCQLMMIGWWSALFRWRIGHGSIRRVRTIELNKRFSTRWAVLGIRLKPRASLRQNPCSGA